MTDKFDQYLAQAEEAEKKAEKAKAGKAQDFWRRIAANYRDLAMMAQAARRKRPTRH